MLEILFIYAEPIKAYRLDVNNNTYIRNISLTKPNTYINKPNSNIKSEIIIHREVCLIPTFLTITCSITTLVTMILNRDIVVISKFLPYILVITGDNKLNDITITTININLLNKNVP